MKSYITEDILRKIIGWLFILIGIISTLSCLYYELAMAYFTGRNFNSRVILLPIALLTIYTGSKILKSESVKYLLFVILITHILELIFNKILSNGLYAGGTKEILFQIPTVLLIILIILVKKMRNFVF